jgi:hypothetical protein
MRDLREVADRRDAAVSHRHLEHGDGSRRHAQGAERPRLDLAVEPARLGGGADDRDGAGMRHRRRDRTEADPLGDAQPMRELDDRCAERLPAIVGFRTGKDQQVALARHRAADDQLRPGQLGEASVDDLERRPPGAVVEELVGLEGRDDRGVVHELREGRGRGVPRVHPPVEGPDERRRDQVTRVPGAARCGQSVQTHRRRIPLGWSCSGSRRGDDSEN